MIKQPSVAPHELEVADGEPEDFFGNQVCEACHKPGKVGDAQHPEGAKKLWRPGLVAVPTAEDWRGRQAGEHLQGDR